MRSRIPFASENLPFRMAQCAGVVALVALIAALAQTHASAIQEKNVRNLTYHGSGTFSTKLYWPTADSQAKSAQITPMSFEKQYHGDLEGVSQGELLTTTPDNRLSGGFVAIEKVSGKLNGRSGTFWLQHHCLLTHAKGEITIVVMPDTATGELTGLSGKLNVVSDEGGQYTFDYTLPEKSVNTPGALR